MIEKKAPARYGTGTDQGGNSRGDLSSRLFVSTVRFGDEHRRGESQPSGGTCQLTPHPGAKS
jgi:hypothetical protein